MIDFEKRLNSLKERRQGSRERAIFESLGFESYSANNVILSGQDIRKKEAFETLKEANGIKYTIGAMSPVDSESTEISKKEGDRVADSLINSLATRNEFVTKRLQGSVALDIHIKGHSDVDMLIIPHSPVHAEQPYVYPNAYFPTTDQRSLLEIARDIRTKSEQILPKNFPKAEIECSGNKSIALSGGSLKRKVDIVPAIWFDGRKYQSSGLDSDRGIKIYHKADHALILNHPFTHIKLINEKDSIYSGNLKCVIRLLKNMVADMPEHKKVVARKLSSYDLASIAFYMNEKLETPFYMRLSLVEKTRIHLNYLIENKYSRDSLDVPDGSRKIFDNTEKADALNILALEITDLATSIYKELKPFNSTYDSNVILNKSVY